MGVGVRKTADFEILVPSGAVAATKEKLLQDSKFGESALKSTYIKIGAKNYNVDVIPHHRAHLAAFPSEKYPQYVTAASIAPLKCMIESKIGAYRDTARASKLAKHTKDGDHLEFLFGKAVEKGLRFGYSGMPGLDRDFNDHFRSSRRESAKSLDSLTAFDSDGDVEMIDA